MLPSTMFLNIPYLIILKVIHYRSDPVRRCFDVLELLTMKTWSEQSKIGSADRTVFPDVP